MRNKSIIVLALVFGLLAAFLVYNYITGAKQAIQNQTYTQVVTAAQDIPANTTITDIMVVLKPFPTELRNGKELVNINDAVGKLAPVAFTKGEVLLENHLVKPGEGIQRLSYKVPNGMRAMTVPITEVTGVGNMITIGDRVDLIAVVPATNQSPEGRTVVILQNIEVLAVGAKMADTTVPGEAPAADGTVTLSVDPQSSLRLKTALQSTSFSFTLRSAADKTFTNLVPVTVNQL